MKKILILGFVLLSLFGCKNHRKPDDAFDKIYGIRLKLPQNLENINDTIKNAGAVFNKPVKIVTNVFFGCGECIKGLQELNDFVDSLHTDKIALIVYGNTDISYSGIYTFLRIVPNFPYPIFADTSKLFLKINKLPEYELAYHTLLVDRNDSVRVIGSPVDNKKISDLYKQEIKKILEEGK